MLLTSEGETHFYKRSRDWINSTLDWNAPITVSLFEVTIRCLGGLLCAYEMTLDPVLLNAAKDLGKRRRIRSSNMIGERFSRAWATPSRIPYTYINLRDGLSG